MFVSWQGYKDDKLFVLAVPLTIRSFVRETNGELAKHKERKAEVCFAIIDTFPIVLNTNVDVLINLFYCCREKPHSRSVGTSTNDQNLELFKALSTCKGRKGF